MSGLTALQREAARLIATFDGESIEVDIAVDSPPLFAVKSIGGIPVLAPKDLVARKVLAVLDRAEGRDFTDLRALARQFGIDRCITWEEQIDSGVSDAHIVHAFA